MEDDDILAAMAKQTYRTEHSPNCPSPYLVRIVGCGILDGLPKGQTNDIIGYGRTFVEAASKALREKEDRRRASERERTNR